MTAKEIKRKLAAIFSAATLARLKEAGLKYWKSTPTAIKAIATIVIALNAGWQLYSRLSPSVEVTPKEKVVPSVTKVEVASKERTASPLPDKPSIAVLAFVNMSDDPKQEYLADGFAEEIINGLSKCPHIIVIARNSSFIYKGKPVKVQQVSEELGVRYVLEGSLQKTGDKVRITLQLIDALTGQHLFSERYDRDLKDILVMQDEITMKILDAVQVKLTTGEDARLRAKGTKNLDAYLKLMEARQCMQFSNKENYALARKVTEEAIALDTQYAVAYATLCKIQLMEVVFGVYKNHREALEQAVKLGEKAITLDESNSLAHATLGATYAWLREYDKAIAEAEKAVSLDPNSAYAYHALGSVLAWAGRPQEAISFIQKSLHLSPIPIDSTTLIRLGAAYSRIGQHEEAVASYRRALQLYGPDHLLAHLGLARTYVALGREKEARAEGAEILRIDPKFSLERYVKASPVDQAGKDRMIEDLRKAGLK
jgi:adenylate cyclase